MARRQHKKTFSCGHRAKGKACYCCQQKAKEAERQIRVQADHRQQQEAWKALFAHDPVNLKGLPQPIVCKARKILAALQAGTHFKHLKGCRLRFDRTVIRIPVGRCYRLLCRDVNGQIMPCSVMSHEAYNAYARNRRQVS